MEEYLYKPFPIVNQLDYEIAVATTKMKGVGMVAIVGAYMPPKMQMAVASDCIDYISDLVGEFKRKYEDCNIVLAGYFNQWPVARLTNEHPDMKEVVHGPTRGDSKIDKFFVNFSSKLTESDTLESLEIDLGNTSDHRAAFFRAIFTREGPEKLSYTYRPYNQEAAPAMVDKLTTLSWMEVLEAEGADNKARALQAILDEQMDRFFPLKTSVRKINGEVLRLASCL